MARAMNFNAGPAALPLEALERAQREFVEFGGTGMSIMEHSHRGKAYEAVHDEAIALLRELLVVPDTHEVLFVQGGASQQFAVVPMNLLPPGKSADYILTGEWSKKAYAAAKYYGTVKVAGTTEKDKKFARIPQQSELQLDPEAAYVHMTTNNTIFGTQWFQYPETGKVPLVADMSSDILWRPTDISKFGLIYAGAQKNIGPSGVTIVIISKALLAAGRTDLPEIFRYKTHADNKSLYNTPPTFAIYMVRNVLAQLKAQGGLATVEAHNRAKAKVIYDAIDARPDFYKCPVDADSRSLMNIVFNLPTPELEEEFAKEATKRNMIGLKGHRAVGGLRASIYNAAQLEWCQALAGFMAEFKKG